MSEFLPDIKSKIGEISVRIMRVFRASGGKKLGKIKAKDTRVLDAIHDFEIKMN